MRKLLYNVYSTINEEQYFALFDEILNIEKIVKPLFKSHNWKLKFSIEKTEGIAFSFCKNEGPYGSFSIVFDDLPDKLSFSSSMMKSIDTRDTRYLLKYNLIEKAELSFFKNDILSRVSDAIIIYNSWTIDDIKKGEKIELR
ncbi:hypothetical protein [Mucilaginibacter sp.]|uniref:hypothetical protein n=1 Tax=Mucilaginibacter sp. TaxID=1882438 RepID=UPI00326432BD